MNKFEHENDSTKPASEADSDLRIAWRYGRQQVENKEKVSVDEQSAAKAFQANYFVMNKFMTQEEVNSGASSLRSFERTAFPSNGSSSYTKLAQEITNEINSLNLNIRNTKSYTNVLRIGTLLFFKLN